MHFLACEIFIFIALDVIALHIQACGDRYRDSLSFGDSHTKIRRKRAWLKGTADVLKDVGRISSKGVTGRLSAFWRIFRAKEILKSDAVFRGTKDNVDRFIKYGGYERAIRDFKILNPHNTISQGDIGGKLKTIEGKVGDNILMMVNDGNTVPVVSMWRVGEDGGRVGTQISVYYKQKL